MQLHSIAPHTKGRIRRRIGRGGKKGTYSGRGLKGQKSRAGARIRPAIRDLLKQFPKRRGYHFKSIRPKPAVVTLHDLETHFKGGETVSPRTLNERGVVARRGGRLPAVKILGEGTIQKAFTVVSCEVSKSVRAKIETAGGVIRT